MRCHIKLLITFLFLLKIKQMVRKNLFLLEYMVKKRIDDDKRRLEAIKKISDYLVDKNQLDRFSNSNKRSFVKEFTESNGVPLQHPEKEVLEELFKDSI